MCIRIIFFFIGLKPLSSWNIVILTMKYLSATLPASVFVLFLVSLIDIKFLI